MLKASRSTPVDFLSASSVIKLLYKIKELAVNLKLTACHHGSTNKFVSVNAKV